MKRYRFDGSDEYGPFEDAAGRYVIHDDCAAEIAKLRGQRDGLAWDLFREHENRSGFALDGEEAIEAHGMRLNEKRDGVEDVDEYVRASVADAEITRLKDEAAKDADAITIARALKSQRAKIALAIRQTFVGHFTDKIREECARIAEDQ